MIKFDVQSACGHVAYVAVSRIMSFLHALQNATPTVVCLLYIRGDVSRLVPSYISYECPASESQQHLCGQELSAWPL